MPSKGIELDVIEVSEFALRVIAGSPPGAIRGRDKRDGDRLYEVSGEGQSGGQLI
jgi:hypothetical protein